MPIHVNDFVIQSKVIEEGEKETTTTDCGGSGGGASGDSGSSGVSNSVKKEIIDECMEKVIAYIDSKQNHF